MEPQGNTFVLYKSFSGEIYEQVLKIAQENGCNYFEFCIRHDIDFLGDYSYGYSENTYKFMEELTPFLVSEIQTNHWVTGMVISREKEATLYRYHLNEQSLMKILEYSNSVSDWCGPKLPEDLVLFQDEKPWLGFIGHEAMSFWFLTEPEAKEIGEIGIDLFDEG